jgi:aryl-alcohol dehydrogenase-like predicted oxidoreductase
MSVKKRTLGKTGICVSEISFGGVEIGTPYGIGIKSKEDMLSEPDAVKLLHAAVDSGINFFDTARMYGESEKIMGTAFTDRRDKVVLCTKCKRLADSNGNIPASRDLKNRIETSLDESLNMLQTDYVDVFMLHQASIQILHHETIAEAFSDLKKKGKIRATGVSTYTNNETRLAIESGTWDVIQLPFNLVDQRQKAFFSVAKEKGIGIVIRSVLLKGLLSAKGKNLHPELKKVEEHIRSYNRLLESENDSLSALATKFVLSFPEISAALIGIDNMKYLRQSLKAANGIYLEENKLKTAEELAYPEPEFINLPHWDKMNWLR